MLVECCNIREAPEIQLSGLSNAKSHKRRFQGSGFYGSLQQCHTTAYQVFTSLSQSLTASSHLQTQTRNSIQINSDLQFSFLELLSCLCCYLIPPNISQRPWHNTDCSSHSKQANLGGRRA